MDIPPPLPVRVPAFRWSAFILCIAGVLFSLQVFAVGISSPTFDAMFKDFEAKLPALTRMVTAAHHLWLVVGVYGVAVSIVLYLNGRRGSTNAFRMKAWFTLLVFIVAQTVTIALFLPIFQLSRIAGEPVKDSKGTPNMDEKGANAAVEPTR